MSAPFRRYYYAKDPATEKSIGGPWISIGELARAVARYEKAGRPYRIAVIQAGTWANLGPDEAEALVAHLDELRPAPSSSSTKRPKRSSSSSSSGPSKLGPKLAGTLRSIAAGERMGWSKFALSRLQAQGLIERQGGAWTVTPAGRAAL